MDSGPSTPVLGSIDSPIDGSIVGTRTLTVTGWALAGGSAVRGVVVLLDGVAVGGAPTCQPRPDLPSELGASGAAEAGFSCVVDLAAVHAHRAARTTATLAVAAILEDGALSPVFARSTLLLRGPAAARHPTATLEGNIDLPEAGARVAPGLVRVEGWAAYGRQPVRDVFVQVDGGGLVRASRRARTDVAAYFGIPALADAGFLAEADVRHLADRPEQEVTIGVTVLVDESAAGGTPGLVVRSLGTATVVVAGAAGPAAASGVVDCETELDPGRPAPVAVRPTAHAAVNGFQAFVERVELRPPVDRRDRDAPPGDSAAVHEAAAASDFGLPVPGGSKFRVAKRLVEPRACWPFLRHQVRFNHAVLEELRLREQQAHQERVALETTMHEVHSALDRLAEELRAALDRQLAETNVLLHEQGVVQRHQLDVIQRQAFQRHHEELGSLRSELAEVAMRIGDIPAGVAQGGNERTSTPVVLGVPAALEPTNGKADEEPRVAIDAVPGASA